MGKNRFVKIEGLVKVKGIARHRDPETHDPDHAMNGPVNASNATLDKGNS